MIKKQIIVRIVLTYLCVILPLLLVSSLLTQSLTTSIQQEELNKLNKQLLQTANKLDEDIHNYTTKSTTIFHNLQLALGDNLSDPRVQMEMVTFLRNLRVFDTQASEIQIYYGQGYLFGDNGIVSPEVYFQTTLACSTKSVADGINLLASESIGVTILDTNIGMPYIFYHIPIGRDNTGNLRSVQYTIPVSVVERLIEFYVEMDSVLLQLSYGDGKIYFYNGPDGCTYLTTSQSESWLAQYDEEPIEAEIPTVDGALQLWHSDVGQIQAVQQQRNMSVLILIIGVFLSTIISISLSLGRMRGISVLANSIVGRKVSKVKPNKWAKNEFNYIQALVNESIEDSNLAKLNIKNYRSIIRQQIAMMMFRGILLDKNDIYSLLSICETELVDEYYYLCGIRLGRKEDRAKLEQYLREDLYYAEEDFVIALCQLQNYDYEQVERNNFAGRLLSTLNNSGITCTQIIISQVVDQITMINYAYLEVRSLLDYAQYSEKVLFWENLLVNKDQNSSLIGNEYLQIFCKAIEQKDHSTAEKMLDKLFAPKSTNGASEDYVRYLRHIVLQAMRLGILSMGVTDSTALLDQINDIAYDLDSDFTARVEKVLAEYCRVDPVFEEILEYVNANYACYDLSLEQIADSVNVSKSQMSKLFRRYTGVGYISYVTNLRMEKAKDLLAQTDINIKDLFNQVGYIDAANASKRFKAIYGVTPRAYRTKTQHCNFESSESDNTN